MTVTHFWHTIRAKKKKKKDKQIEKAAEKYKLRNV